MPLDALQPLAGRRGWTASVKDQFPILMGKYGDLVGANAQAIDYSDPSTQAAYLFKYVGPHAHFISDVLERARANSDAVLFGTSGLNVACIGGGPGSDVLGVLEYAERYRDEHLDQVAFELLDGEPAWRAVSGALESTLAGRVRATVTVSEVDATDASTLHGSKLLNKARLITVSYFLSEVMRLGARTDRFWVELLARAPSGALFLYLDFWSPGLNAYIDDLFDVAEFETVLTGSDREMTVSTNRDNVFHLEPHRTNFDHYPPRTGKVAYRVFRKP